MPVTNYRIWWGAPVNENLLTSRESPIFVAVSGIAKPPKAAHPYEIANEIVCADLGRGLCLPIPAGIVATKESDGIAHYVSFDLALYGENLPPANIDAIAAELPDLACGVILFDLWIANADRTVKNLIYFEDTKSLHLIDHGRAIFCGANWKGRLGSLDDGELIRSNCLTERIKSSSGFQFWSDRIKQLPKQYIIDVVAEAKKFGISAADVEFCAEFLLKRRNQLLKITKKYKGEFHSVVKDLFA